MFLHTSDCSVHNEPALPKGKCDCSAVEEEGPSTGCQCSECNPVLLI
jgi:hypothetical protein